MTMIPELPPLAWLVLAALAYALISCVLGCLAARVRNEVERHDLAVRAHQQRHSYRESVRQAQERVNSRARHKAAA